MTRRTPFRRLFGLDPAGDVDDELSFHVEMRVRELVERGEAPARARELALGRFGDYERSRRECVAIDRRRRARRARAEYLMELRQDIVYALRMLRRTPTFTAVAVAALALGIGACTAIFSVVHGVLLTGLPYRDAERLYHVQMLYPDGTIYPSSSAPDFMSIREQSRAFEQVDAFTTATFTLVAAGDAREVEGAAVSDGFFGLLGFDAALGRTFARDEHQPGRGAVTVLDHGFWTREFGADPAILGRGIVLSGTPYTVVGVLARGASLPAPADVYVPLEYDETFSAATDRGRRGEYLDVFGRARPGVEAAQVGDDLRRVGADLQQAFPNTNARLTFTATRVIDVIVGDVRTPLFVLLGAVGFVLLVACGNVAHLLLARATVRQGELAVRAALGASRWRIVRQLLTESVVLAGVGGAAGLALAWAGTRALVAAQPAEIPRLESVGVSGEVVLFALAAVCLTSVIVGIVPALLASGTRLTEALREGGRGSGPGAGSHRARATLVVAELALAVVLLAGAGLLIRSFIHLTGVDPGFRPEGAVSFRVPLQGPAYEDRADVRRRVEQIEERLRALPGVEAAAGASLLPLSGRGGLIDFAVDGAPPPPPSVNREIGIASASPGYFKAIGTPLLQGRLFDERDHPDAPRTAIINAAAARFWFPDQDPLGRTVTMSGRSHTIVGIVGDVLQRGAGQPAAPQLYTPYAQRPTRTVRMVVRAAGDPAALAGQVRAEIRAIDPALPVERFMPLDELVGSSLARPRFYTSLLSLFAAAALVLAATGIFGVMSYTVAQRAREIGIRLALGAQPRDVLRLVGGRAAALTALGLALGLAGAFALREVIQSQLVGVAATDTATLVGVALVLAVSAALASLLPVLRAMRLDPAGALREG